MIKDNLRNCNNLQKIYENMSIHYGPLNSHNSGIKSKSRPNAQKNSKKTENINIKMILDALDTTPIKKDKENTYLTNKKDLDIQQNGTKKETKNERRTENSKDILGETKDNSQNKKELDSIKKQIKKDEKKSSAAESIYSSSNITSELSNNLNENEKEVLVEKSFTTNKRERSPENEEDEIESSSKLSIESEYVEETQGIAEKENKKKRKNNSEYLKTLPTKKPEKKKFAGKRKKCGICGKEIGWKSEKYHLITKHKGKGLKDIEKENCFIEYSKRRLRKICVIINDIDNMRKKLKINGTSDYNIFLRNMNNMRDSCYTIININKRKPKIFTREAQGKIPH